jgi:5-methylcytosine-specific restriction endonuclease McrA
MTNDTISKLPSTHRTQCGTRSGHKQHYKLGEEYCDPCKQANREYQTFFRKKKFIPFENRVAPTEHKSCGTPRGRDLHEYYGELSCEPCRVSGNKRIVEYDADHPDARHARSRKWHIENPELSKAANKKWRNANAEKVSIKNRRQRAVKLSAITEPYTITKILEKYGNDCHICNEPIDLLAPRRPGKEGWELGLQLDHVVPLSKGGSDTIDNVKPSHCSCNLSKRASIR